MEAEPSNPPEVYKNAAGFAPPVVTTTVSAGGRTYVNLDSKNWQGGTTTVVTPSSAAPLFADLQSHTMMEERKVNRGGGRKSASLKDEELCPEVQEEARGPDGDPADRGEQLGGEEEDASGRDPFT